MEYSIYRLKRLPDSPHKISIGLAMGVFASFTPLFGMHFVIAGLLAHLFKGNILAAIIGTFFGNPITWPFIASLSVNLGQIFLGRSLSNFETFLDHFIEVGEIIWAGLKFPFVGVNNEWGTVIDFLNEIFLPYSLGGFVLGLAAGLASYFVFRPIIYAYKVARNKRKSKRIQRSKKLKESKLNEQF